jgi:hypothetical protein
MLIIAVKKQEGLYFSGLCCHLEELPDNPVVLPEVDGVEGGQGRLFACPVVASHEAFSRLCLKILNWA